MIKSGKPACPMCGRELFFVSTITRWTVIDEMKIEDEKILTIVLGNDRDDLIKGGDLFMCESCGRIPVREVCFMEAEDGKNNDD